MDGQNFLGGDNIFWTADQGSGQDIFLPVACDQGKFSPSWRGARDFFCITPDKCFPKEGSKHLLSCFSGFSPLHNCVTSQINFQGCKGGHV